jgi:hypothetical protein
LSFEHETAFIHNVTLGNVSLEKFYHKPILVIAPDLTFGNTILACLKCPICSSVDSLKSDGWSDSYRYVHSIKSGERGLDESEQVLMFSFMFMCVVKDLTCSRSDTVVSLARSDVLVLNWFVKIYL